MSQIARDSGIVADDDSSETSSMRANEDYSQLSYVQRLRKRFELLSKENEREFHSNCNWWLEDEDQRKCDSTSFNPPEITLDTVEDEDDEVFESADDIEEEIEAQYVRHHQNKLTLSRPGSITSQISNISTTSKLFNIVKELIENERKLRSIFKE
ncbi:hypothetical protein PVAND_014880 [Polypedilum vanderplanki]|uniref:Uncharacterized protein n=1 Tax=Polypedilum vanderplanki TaxID=319348 RepID=A0A9J6BBD1_POLVA|nr:hypothetical protein PVAND_014880 [Polypedilum vanderplanki]